MYSCPASSFIAPLSVIRAVAMCPPMLRVGYPRPRAGHHVDAQPRQDKRDEYPVKPPHEEYQRRFIDTGLVVGEPGPGEIDVDIGVALAAGGHQVALDDRRARTAYIQVRLGAGRGGPNPPPPFQ